MQIKGKNSLISACISTLYKHSYIGVFEYLETLEKLEKPFMRVLICFIYFPSFPKHYIVITFRKNIPKNTSLIVNTCTTDFYIFREKNQE